MYFAQGSHQSPGDALQKVFTQNVQCGIYKNAQIRQLMHYSKSVDFVVKVRNNFLNSFELFKAEFPAIDAKAMFAGTIIHGLDRANLYDCVLKNIFSKIINYSNLTSKIISFSDLDLVDVYFFAPKVFLRPQS